MRLFSRRFIAPTGVVVAVAACSTGDAASPEWNDVGGAPAPTAGAATTGTRTNDVGRVTMRRLNGAEFDNTVRDLLGETTKYSLAFPPDNGAEGFTNNGDALSISPLLFEKYEGAAETLARNALANPRVMRCESSAHEACATEILSRFLPRAWRRAVTRDEVSKLVALVAAAEAEDLGFETGLELALKAALLSPHFLFRVEIDPDPTSTEPHPLGDYEIASRLSYFLWSSMPDDALLAYASAGKLQDPPVFDLEVARMLRDPKASALVDEFAAKWLIHSLADNTPDPTVFPAFDEDLRKSMEAETKTFLRAFLFGDESFVDVVDAPFSFLDARMAEHYGIAGVTSATPVRVVLPASAHRAGILGHASVLMQTSVARRTSPVRRGEWVLSELLCAPPPPPPPGIPALEANATTGTIRQRMEAHRKNPVCATCHSKMDPIGFSLERYDAIGRWRDTDQGLPIDTTGQLPDGTTIDGAADLARAIKADPRLPRCATRKLYAYALGRAPADYDAERLSSLSASFVASQHRARDLIVDIIHSDAFRMRRGGK